MGSKLSCKSSSNVLSELQRKAVTFVTIAKLKDLDEAIAKARKAEASEYYSRQTNEKSHQKKVKEELGNLSQKIEQITLNYDALTLNWPKAPSNNDQCWNPYDSHIACNCLSERKQKRDPKECQSTNYMGWVDPYNNNQEGLVKDEVYALAEKCHQPYPINGNQEKRIQAQLRGTWKNRLRPRKKRKPYPYPI
ncbi:36608_t:CDS:2 [Gigaspora margarita]|uniref:36608_t:CDS:1 n=1 Tax=Gigaspora margarita TaxID=4874 RepID=A0ABN7UY09_GIGMA|nr:36608_t:CDS:2 [Gigaspora margarita]